MGGCFGKDERYWPGKGNKGGNHYTFVKKDEVSHSRPNTEIISYTPQNKESKNPVFSFKQTNVKQPETFEDWIKIFEAAERQAKTKKTKSEMRKKIEYIQRQQERKETIDFASLTVSFEQFLTEEAKKNASVTDKLSNKLEKTKRESDMFISATKNNMDEMSKLMVDVSEDEGDEDELEEEFSRLSDSENQMKNGNKGIPKPTMLEKNTNKKQNKKIKKQRTKNKVLKENSK